MENLADNYKHIKGWGIDADPADNPNYPIKHWTGDDHNRLNYERAPQQARSVEILQSTERPNITRVFGTSAPPSGLSGMLRRFAFKYSEGEWTHWLSLLAADRINMVEGIIQDLGRGYVPNIFAERGWGAEWKHNKKGVLKTAATGALVGAILIGLIVFKKRKRKGLTKGLHYIKVD